MAVPLELAVYAIYAGYATCHCESPLARNIQPISPRKIHSRLHAEQFLSFVLPASRCAWKRTASRSISFTSFRSRTKLLSGDPDLKCACSSFIPFYLDSTSVPMPQSLY